MIDTACEPRALRYRVTGNPPRWHAHKTYGLPALQARGGRPSMASLVLLSKPVPRRAGMLALALLSYGTLTRVFTSGGLPRQYLIALVLALVLSIAWTLLELRATDRTVTVIATGPSASDGGEAHPAPVRSVTKLLPEPAARKAFDNAVRRAITHLCDPTRLAVSSLLQLSCVTARLHDQGLEDTPLHRVAILKAVLIDLINGLRSERRIDGCTGAAYRFYNCLYYPYVLGITRRRAPAVLRDLRERREQAGGPHGEQEQVPAWLLQVDEDTYYKWQRRASDTIAHILREREQLLGGNVPAVGGRAVSA